MSLFVPAKAKRHIPDIIKENKTIKIQTYNFVGAEGFDRFKNLIYKNKLAMPRPRNILIPAIMCGIWSGYKTIYITGADHSWMKTLSVNENNNVVSIQPHFYQDDTKEHKRVSEIYRDLKLHQVVHSFYVAFKSYHDLQNFAIKNNIQIFNATPESFIDAFPRKKLPQ